MSNFYKMDPAAWDFGTADLSLEEEAAYLRIVNAINKHDAPVPNNDRVLAGMFRCSTRKARALLTALEDAGKVYIEGGKIWNERARSDVVHRQLASVSASERGAKGGRVSAERRSKPLEDNEPRQATASSRIEENRIDKPPKSPKGDLSGFDAFWKDWPNKTAKEAARKAWRKLPPDDRDAAAKCAVQWFTAWRNSHPQASPIHPASYLNSKRWTDEDLRPQGQQSGGAQPFFKQFLTREQRRAG